MRKRFFLMVVWMTICLESSETRAQNRLISLVIPIVESNNNDWAIGDKRLAKKAYGSHQIRQPVCDDVNRRYGTRYRAEKMRGNRALSERVCRLYLGLHATKKRLGRAPTNEDRARIWNGGPDGWQRAETVKYWKKIKQIIADEKKKGGRR